MHYDAIIAGRYSKHIGIGIVASGILDSVSYPLRCTFFDARPELSNFTDFPDHVPIFKPDLVPTSASVLIYTDVLWNGHGDYSIDSLPRASLNIAYTMFDSSQLPTEWVSLCNDRFDAVVVPDEEVKKVYVRSGVWKPVFVLPVPLDLAPYLEQPFRPSQSSPYTFGSVVSFHPRKNIQLLIRAFLEAFGGDNPDVHLRIHSNLAFSSEFKAASHLVLQARATNISLTCENLGAQEYVSLLSSFDALVQVSKGEGYSIPPRQALALGKDCVLSDTMAHKSLCSSGLVYSVAAPVVEPAIYDEINGMTYGCQYSPIQADIVAALKACRNREISSTAEQRRQYAKQFSVPELKDRFKTLLSPANVFVARYEEVKHNCVLTTDSHLCAKYQRTRPLPFLIRSKGPRKKVIIGHDGGFFSLFNTFFSHLVWGLGQGSIKYVLPDWRVRKMKEVWQTSSFTSFCYGAEADGNIWLKVFEPLYEDLSPRVYEEDELLYADTQPFHSFNEKNEPLLTYIHAYQLYRMPNFAQWRHWYNLYYSRFIKPRPHIQAKVDELYYSKMEGLHCIGVHARHPSHAIEQPDGKMPYLDRFVDLASALQTGRLNGQDWRVFLATDQETVVKHFRKTFGERLITVSDIARTTEAQDEAYQTLTPEQRNKEGFQIQHLVAADASKWSVRMAEEVIVDSLLLARCQSFVHTTSNIATAVSFMNPNLHMVYCE